VPRVSRMLTGEHHRALAAFGFQRLAASAGARDAVRWRPVQGRWGIEVVAAPAGLPAVDLGLTVEPGRGALVGPVHRAPSAAALAAALPCIVASLEALAAVAESLRCPDCHTWEVMRIGTDGPYLACGEAPRGRRPFARTEGPCRRNLSMKALVLYDERGAPR